VQEFMLGFALSDDGGVVISDLGEAPRELFEKTYPVLSQAKQQSEVGIEEPVKDGGSDIRAAVEKERTRLEGRMLKRRAKSPAARALQKELGMSATVAERHEQVARGKQDKRKLQ